MKLSTSALIVICWGLCVPAAQADYAGEVLKDRPVAWWRLGDPVTGNGMAVSDVTGRHPGIYHGNTSVEGGVPGIGGKAALFDGTTAYVEVPDHKDFALDILSVECWFKTKQSWTESNWPASASLISKATEGNGSGDWVILGGAAEGVQGCAMAQLGPTGGTDAVVASPGGLNDEKWHHLVWTHAARVNQWFVDGVKVTESDDSGGSILNDRPIQIGGDPFLNGKFFHGQLAEVAIYQTALDESRVVAHLKAAGVSPRRPAIVAAPIPLETLALKNPNGLEWDLWRNESGWSLGQISLHGKPLDMPSSTGVLALRNIETGELHWLAADHAERIAPHAARLSGLTKINDATLRFGVEIALQESLPAATWNVSWSVDKDLKGWEVCLAYHGSGQTDWRCTIYPFAGNDGNVALAPMKYCGIPAVLIYRPDLSMVALFGIDPASDYLNPTSWTGTTGFHFKSGQTPPQFRVGGGKLAAGIQYGMPLQLFLSDAGESAKAISGLAKNWIALNKYRVEPLHIRSHQEGFDLFLQGRLKGGMWHEGLGYQIMENWKVVYTAESPINAWFDYLLYEQSGDPLWRKRAFDAMDLVLKAQHTDPADLNFGALETNYELDTKAINSNDHTDNWHYKVDMNSFAARYILQVWQKVKAKEGIDRKDWYQCAVQMADWVMKQQNPDGGLPQVVDDKQNRKSISVISGRSLTAFPIIYRITGDEKYARFASQLETFLRIHVEGRYWFTGAHVDLYPKDFEADSVWHAVEYWIDKYDLTKDVDCLRRAEADAWFAFLMFCPKQLSWVKNPTQTCHTEQQHFLQYSNYCYNNRKYVCLDRLAKLTGEKLFGDLCERIIQCGFWAQPTSGPWVGGINERMSDPWKALSNDFNSTAQVYTGELATDAALQLLEMGLAKPQQHAAGTPK